MPDNMPAPERVERWAEALFGDPNHWSGSTGDIVMTRVVSAAIALADRESAERVEAGPTWARYDYLRTELCESAKQHGWEEDQGTGDGPAIAEGHYNTAVSDLDAFVRRLLALAKAGRAVPEGLRVEFRPFDPPQRDKAGQDLIDEIVTCGVSAHLEMLSDSDAYLGFDAPNGHLWQTYIHASKGGRLKVTCEVREGHPPSKSPVPPTAPHDQEHTL